MYYAVSGKQQSMDAIYRYFTDKGSPTYVQQSTSSSGTRRAPAPDLSQRGHVLVGNVHPQTLGRDLVRCLGSHTCEKLLPTRETP